jgi:thymidylate synthase (FAD)
MVKWDDVKDDPKAIKCLDHGFIVLKDVMGNDETIVESARVSYGTGTKKVSETRGLIRYLMRHYHSTPFEMVEFRFLCKMPIFVARQWVRHRTANINEYSGRYSVMCDEFYVPELHNILPQSTINNQGRGGNIDFQNQHAAQLLIEQSNESCYNKYQRLLGMENNVPVINGSDKRSFTTDFDGIAREIARGVLNVNNYTEWYWKCDLHNIFNFMRLRKDTHAQYEIRVYANAMAELVKKQLPIAYEAFEDYILHAKHFSRAEMDILKILLGELTEETIDVACSHGGLSAREIRELKSKLIDQ